MYLIIDESGIPNLKKNRYFIIGGFICKDVTKIRSIHKKIEKQIKFSRYEFIRKWWCSISWK